MNNIFSAMNNPFGNIQNLMAQYNQFKQTFKGDPQETVNRMLQSGQINETQVEQAKQMAQQFRSMLK